MVNHYTVSKKHRQKDSYSPGGQMGLRPDRAVIVYSNLIRQTYKKTPIILGGIEASLRRLAHYDYWENKVKHSVLLDSGADMISYGMGEHSIIEIADALASGLPVEELTYIAGTVFKCRDLSRVYDPIILPSYEEVKAVYDKYYGKEKFVRVLEKDVCPETKWVEGSNYVDIGFKIDPRTNRIIMMGAIDNLVKGAAGQAVQNMNLMFGERESEGLELVPLFP